jgi:ribosomal protein S18 acetylase RimI-like enzyme
MGQRIDIRSAGRGDAQAMAEYTELLVAEKLDTILLDKSYTPADEEKMLAEYETSGSVFLLALEGARVVGMADLRRGARTGNHHLGVLGMGVLSTYRGQGIGRRLITQMIEEARAMPGLCRIELGVTPWNTPAIALYESLGFVLEGVKKKGINLRGVPEDDLFMALVW